MEERRLLCDRVSTAPGKINHKENGGPQMRECRDGQHFNCVAVLEGVVENSGRIDDLAGRIEGNIRFKIQGVKGMRSSKNLRIDREFRACQGPGRRNERR